MIVLLLALLGQIEHPPQRVGEVVGRLTVEVPERTDRFSPPRLRMEVRVSGTGIVEVEAAQLGEEVRSWQVKSQVRRHQQGESLEVTQRLDLEQTRPGMQTVPGVRVRVKLAGDRWHQFEWASPLGELQANLRPDLPTEEPRTSGRLWPVVSVVVAALMFLVLRRLRGGPRREVELTPVEQTRRRLRELREPEEWRRSPRTAAMRLSEILRDYLGQRLQQEVATRTVTECIELLREQGRADPELERLLAWCDAVRFGGESPDAGAANGWVTAAENVVERLEATAKSVEGAIVPE